MNQQVKMAMMRKLERIEYAVGQVCAELDEIVSEGPEMDDPLLREALEGAYEAMMRLAEYRIDNAGKV